MAADLVPFIAYAWERPTMREWLDARSDATLRAYWAETNTKTLVGMPTDAPTS